MKLEHDMKLFLKTLVPLILAGMILGAAITWATTPTTTFYISTGVYPGAPYYTVWAEGAGASRTYYTKRYDGYIPTFSGSTNASYVIQSSINACTDGHDVLLLSDSTGFTITNTITIGKKIAFGGTSRNCYLVPSGATPVDPFLNVTANDCTIHDLTIDGWGSTNNRGIIVGSNGNRFFNVKVTGMAGSTKSGVKVTDWSQDFYSLGLENCAVSLEIASGGNNVRIFGGEFYSNVAGSKLIVINGGDSLQIYGTDLEGNATQTTGIYVNYSNSEFSVLGGRFESLLNGVDWDYGQGDRITDCFFATVTNLLVSPPLGTVCKGNFGLGDIYTIEHHTGNDLLTVRESGTIHTNNGSGGDLKLTLPQDAIAGTMFEFTVMAAHQLQIDPGAAGAIYINGAKQADDSYIWADDEGESVKLVCDGNHDWIVLYTVGTWTVV